jgi:hypothetical protein
VIVAASEQLRKGEAKGPITRPPVQPEIGSTPFVNLVLSTQFKVPFDLLYGVPELRSFGGNRRGK